MSKKLAFLGNLTAEQFLDEYWQKKPLLIRNAFPGFTSPLSADELAGLALEDEVESRLVLEQHGPGPWTVEHGPFTEARFQSLPATYWTLLVQGVDTLVDDVETMLEPFRFIPDWRIDDIMVSYAVKHGSVGPHLDQYDVFLVQAQGHRHWQISTAPYSDEDCIPDIELRILKNFQAEQEWTLAPGDMLYLPPGVAHYGIAQDECITFSVGFRAPSQTDLLSAFIDDLLPQLDDTQRYQDPDIRLQSNPGQISEQALEKIRHTIRLQQLDDEHINRWFGRYITEPKHEIHYQQQDRHIEETRCALDVERYLQRDSASRFAYIEQQPGCILFVNGIEYTTNCELARYLCQHKAYQAKQLLGYMDDASNQHTITSLLNQQLLSFIDV